MNPVAFRIRKGTLRMCLMLRAFPRTVGKPPRNQQSARRRIGTLKLGILTKQKGTSTMRNLMIAITTVMVLALAVASYVEAAVLTATNSKCVKSQCGGKMALNDDGTIAGCRESYLPGDHSCVGRCYDCTATTALIHCEKRSCSTCFSDTSMAINPCGNKTYFPCTGTTYPNCDCNFSAGATPSTDACGFRECVLGDGGAK